MKYITIIILILNLSINFSCLSQKNVKQQLCRTEYLKYYNYTGIDKAAINKIKFITNLKEIDNNLLNFYLEHGINFEDAKQSQIIVLPKSEFFNNPDLKGEISFCLIGYIENNNIKQYIASEINFEGQQSLYIINQTNDKITSSFLVYSNYNSGFSSESVETKRSSDFIYQISVYYTADNNKGGKCNYLVKLSANGYVEFYTDIQLKN